MKSPDYTSKPASEHTRAFNGSAATPSTPKISRGLNEVLLRHLKTPRSPMRKADKRATLVVMPSFKATHPTLCIPICGATPS